MVGASGAFCDFHTHLANCNAICSVSNLMTSRPRAHQIEHASTSKHSQAGLQACVIRLPRRSVLIWHATCIACNLRDHRGQSKKACRGLDIGSVLMGSAVGGSECCAAHFALTSTTQDCHLNTHCQHQLPAAAVPHAPACAWMRTDACARSHAGCNHHRLRQPCKL